MRAEDVVPDVRVDVLGPVRLVIDGEPVDVRGPKRCAVLALLAMAGGRAVSADHLVDALWPATAPESGRAALHSHVSRLRGHLGSGAERLVTVDGGYRLALDRGGLDVERAQTLLAKARATRGSDPAAAYALLRDAVALWRGPAFADLTGVTTFETMAVGLEHLHQELTDELIGCALDTGDVEGIVALAAGSSASDPLREPAVLLLMRALAVTGQAPQALRTAREYRHRLAAETGLDPSAELGNLERDIASGAIGPRPARTTSSPAVRPAPAPARPANRLVGREAELTALQRLVRTERLVTIVGPGGIGKTRIAIELARQAETATVLALAPLTDAVAIPHALAAALGLREVRGDVQAACLAVLDSSAPHLLVVDNCEHLLDDVRELVAAVLQACPRVSVVGTSREPLGLAAESPLRLAPLPLPSLEPLGDRGAHAPDVPSVALFLERAAKVRPGFTPGPDGLRLIAQIVRALDGIPLAIELAAGRLSSFSLADLSSRLDRSLDLLGGGTARSDSRHRTLRSTVEWSYELLTSEERRLFRHLSVFPDGVDLATAEYVAADLGLGGDPGAALAKLVDASMIEVRFDGQTRYRMLGTIRAFGLDRLVAVDEDAGATQRLLRWAISLVTWIAASQTTEREPEADAALRRELTNLRAAWQAARQEPLPDKAAALVIAMSDVTSWRDLAETWGWAEQLADDPALAGYPCAAEVMGAAATAAYMRGDYTRADRLARAGLERAADAGGSGRCLGALALADLSRAAYPDAVRHSLAAAELAAQPSENLGIAALALTYAHDLDRARGLAEQMLSAAGSPTLRAFAAYVSGEIATAAGQPDRAEEHYTVAVDLARTSGASFLVGIAAVGLLTVSADAGRTAAALRGYRDLIDYWDRCGNWTQQWVTLRNLAGLLRHIGDDESAAVLDAAADQAPDAPVSDGGPTPTTAAPHSTPPALGGQSRTVTRTEAMVTAREAIARNLA